MLISSIPIVDLVVLTSRPGPLRPEVERGLGMQQGVQLRFHRVVGSAQPTDRCRYETIARARNEGKLRGSARWLIFVDDDVVLEPQCVATLLAELSRRPAFAALGADYLGEHREGRIALHVSMGATLFRRAALNEIRFRWGEKQCECQCCCDDLRQHRWGIDYLPAAHARHLQRGQIAARRSPNVASHGTTQVVRANCPAQPAPAPSVCLVACYFGPPPGWIKQYLLSCAYNPSIDFLLMTDQASFPAVPANVRVRRLSQAAFCELARRKIGVTVDLKDLRKLCDFKPAYGQLFEELLTGWQYWGYTDLDVIYGDIRRFLARDSLESYDIFTARQEFLVGHFTLLRNNRRMRLLYQESTDFRGALQSPRVLSFDECGLQWVRRLQGKPLSKAATCDSMTHVVHRLLADKVITARFAPAVIEWPELANSDWRLRWNAGRLWIVGQCREAMYFHFHAFKQRPGFRAPCKIEGDTFEISPRGFERPAARWN